MDIIKKLKIKKQDGTFSDYIPIGAEASNITRNNNENVEESFTYIENNCKLMALAKKYGKWYAVYVKFRQCSHKKAIRK